MQWALLFFILQTSSFAFSADKSLPSSQSLPAAPKVIYGEDSRREILHANDPSQILVSQATLAIIPSDFVESSTKSKTVRIIGRKYGEEFNLCSDEQFTDQPTVANCSGLLVAEDLIATAGHCVTTYDCETYKFVFGYHNSAENEAPELLPAEDVYSCKEVVAHELNGTQDYALIKLDRVVTNRKPLSLQKSAVVAKDPIYVIGHPGGLPTKIADGAEVRKSYQDFFSSNLDTYGGSSGSAVFNARTHEVVGILVRGENDFVYNSDRKCYQSNRCLDHECRGEDATDIRFIDELLSGHRS